MSPKPRSLMGSMFAAILGASLSWSLPAEAETTGEHERVHAAGPRLWIYSEPRRSLHPIGYLRAGTSAKLKDSKPVWGSGCPQAFVEIEPFGFVCPGRNAVFEPTRYVRAMRGIVAKDAPLLFSYALSDGAPMYRRLPTADEVKRSERAFRPEGVFQPLSRWQQGHEELAVARMIPADGGVPWFAADVGSAVRLNETQLVRREIPHGSALAYVSSFEHDGRTYLLSSDGTFVPAGRVRPFAPSSFEGTELDGKTLPMAWVRANMARSYRRSAAGEVKPAHKRWSARSSVYLADQRLLSMKVMQEAGSCATVQEIQVYRTRSAAKDGEPLYVAADDVALVEPLKSPPARINADQKWISFSISRGVLIAYEGDKPVFTTLASPGAGGMPVRGRDPVKHSTTPIGTFRITFKHLADDMSPDQGNDRRYWLAEVPYAQYFAQPFAIHVAYWHESFGEPMSGGCINVSPRDGKRLFEWSDPQLPPGWGAVGVGSHTGSGTTVVVVR